MALFIAHQHLFLPKDYSGSPTVSLYIPWTEAEVLSQLTAKVKLVRYYNALQEILVPRRGLAPPIGDDPTHKPLKTRLSLDFSSCNRRILVYGLVYVQDPSKCQYAP